MRDGLRHATKLGENLSYIAARIGIIGLELQSPFIGLHRLEPSLKFDEDIAAVVVRLGKIRPPAQGSLILLQRCRQAASLRERVAQIIMGRRMVGI